MSSNSLDQTASGGKRRSDILVLLAIATAVAIFHLLTDNRYGFHRDELQFLSDARHLDWGFVAFPPFTPFVERVGLSLFGLSLVGLRLFSVIAQALLIFVAGLMARELGGGRLAQVTTALAVAFSPLPVFEATEFQYTSFAMLWWVLIAYFTVRLLKSEDPRWWLAIGAAIGVGLETKYAIVFYIAGILAGLLFTRARRYFASKWLWGGVGIALLIFLPNLIWLIRHDFISYTFLQHIHARDVGEGRADGFWKGQFLYDANVAAAPLWIAGLIGYLVSRRYRMLAWMYFVPVALFFAGKGRFYYTAGAYPMLLAMGAVVAECWLGRLPRWARVAVEGVWGGAFVFVSVVVCARLMPIAASGPLKAYALRHSEDLREEIGWNELVRTVAGIRDSLPADEQAHLGITTANYGEYGAIEILGRAYHLPEPIGTTNSEWYWGYPTPPPTTIIVLGLTREQADSIFTGCRLAGHNGNSLGVQNEESEYHPDIFLCGPLRFPWAEAWKRHRDFG
ncbi:MAG TPA: glycosyltransferase family 39 protein [Acidobacteriaceae bacterium]|nr:glycosyltransferase family 39 protein [Acidobacteriaceae bacterium]